ncbi:MAG: Gfo/Idh/MocA family oxidoreductase [Planctomycetota bacterium]|nr:Gfo/Idh/MocA family oxidoreductase [Planctomycetota bacterium]
MLKLGIVGSDNSHAIHFSQRCNLPDHPQRVEGARVVAICGKDPKRTREVAEQGRIEAIVGSPAEMVGKIDAGLVVYRHGGLHLENARPLLEAGIPVFVDKPLACSVADAKAILEIAEWKNVPVTSFSTVRLAQSTRKFIAETLPKCGRPFSAVFTGPCDPKSEYGGIFFYGIHAIEMMFEFLGYDIADVSARRIGNHTIATVRYADGTIGIQNMLCGGRGFSASVHGKGGDFFFPYDDSTAYSDGLRTMIEMFRTRTRPYTDEQLLSSPRLLEAIEKSVAAGGAVVPF